MSTRTKVMSHLKQFGICGCHVRRRNIISFCAQKWDIDDVLEPRETALFTFNPDRPKADQWASRGLDNVTGIHGCACFKPQERWVFVSDPGEVYVVGQGENGYEKPIDARSKNHFPSVKCIAGGYAYVAGLQRKVYKRTGANQWVQLADKSLVSGSMDNVGFNDIDGFSDKDIYACGEQGDLWSYNGKKWTREDVPTDANLEKICCADDGIVYITTNRQELLIGKKSSWRTLEQDVSDQIFEDIVNFDSKILVSTDETIYELEDEKLIKTKMSLPKMDLYTHLAAGDGVMVIAGEREAFMYSEKKWTKLFKFVKGTP